MEKICLLCSGHLGLMGLQTLLEQKANIVYLMTNASSEKIIALAKIHHIPIYIGNPRHEKASLFIQKIQCTYLLSINYLFIIEQPLIKKASEYALNIHGSLLPKYRGRTPHVWAIINGEKETGVSIHKIETEVDTGDITLQKSIPISEQDTGHSILEKFSALYRSSLIELLPKLSSKSLSFKPQQHQLATYFSKRTPEDGCINWNWQAFRIINWVRAQCPPYPGAFTHLDEQKIIITKARLSPLGFNDQIPNGSIMEVNQHTIFIKTPNSVLNCTTSTPNLKAIKPGKVFNSENN